MQPFLFYGSAVLCGLISVFLIPLWATILGLVSVAGICGYLLWSTRNDEIGSLVGVIAVFWGAAYIITALISLYIHTFF